MTRARINGMHVSRDTRRWIAGSLTAVLLAATSVVVPRPEPAIADGLVGIGVAPARAYDTLRGHELKTLDGQTLVLDDLQGEVVVVNFWASWCRPCRRELPALDELHAELVKKGGRVIAVSIDHDARNASRFAKAHKLSLPIYHDGPEGLARKLDLTSIPFTLVIDRDGSVAYTTTGSNEEALADLQTHARKLVGKKPYAAATNGGTP